MAQVTMEDLTIVLGCLPGRYECIENISRADRMREGLREVIRDMARYIYIVNTLATNNGIKGNTLGFLLAAPIDPKGEFIYGVTDDELKALKEFPERFKDENPFSASLLSRAIDRVIHAKSLSGTAKVETAPQPQDTNELHALRFFRKYPEEIRYGVKGAFTPVYYTSTDMINIFNTLARHDRTHKDCHEDPILAVGPMSKAMYDLMQFPMGFPREGYAPVLDLEAKLLLLVPLSIVRRQYDVLMSEPV